VPVRKILKGSGLTAAEIEIYERGGKYSEEELRAETEFYVTFLARFRRGAAWHSVLEQAREILHREGYPTLFGFYREMGNRWYRP
jgi:hypothetical protein